MRLVLIDCKKHTAVVYEGKSPLASYEFNPATITKEEIEQIRVFNYKEKA